ncbi:MAG: sensor histidine kinase [Microthrixaceae bacterium]|nr:sensor histidine kinase [Microthrixaceae bacterium]
MANVVANALAVRPVGTVVRVEALAAVDDVVELRVIDHGPGIAADDREAAVQAFQRLGDGTTRAGVGLGLAIAEGFADAMGATFGLRDTPGGGLTVAFGFAVAADPPGRSSTASGAA